jgi:DNA repair protein RadC
MRIATLHDAEPLLAAFFAGAEEERVVAMHLDSARLVLGLTLERIGGREDVDLPLGAIAASALRLGAVALIVAHNHPSGDPEPSDADKAATLRLADALRPLGVRLLDHLIFAGDDSRSMAALGLL